MAVNLFGKIKDRANEMRNKMTDSMVNDVKDLRNDEFKTQMQNARKQNDNLSLWDKYKRTGQKIDVPEFDAKIVDLPKEDENEKEIKIDRTPKTSVLPSFMPTGRTDLEALAGNGLPIEEELPTTEEPTEPKGTSVNIPREENPEWDLEDLAGNGQRETPKPETIVEDTDDTVVGEPTLEEPNNEEETDDTFVGEPEFDESDVVDPEDNPDLLSDEEAEKIEEDAKAEEEQKVAEEEKQKSEEEEKKKAEEEQKKNPEEDKDKDKDKDEEPTETVRTESGPINDDSDLLKKGGGVDINEMVDRSQIPHYNYLSFFQ